MKRWSALLAVLALVVAACGDSGEDTTPTTAATPTTVAATPETAAPEPDITDAPAAAEGTIADLAITEVVFGESVTISNLGTGPVSVDGLWLCNRPSYTPMPTALIAPGESITVAAGDLGGLSDGSGEVAMYTSNNFGASSDIIDYVTWGQGGGRLSVAADAGIWPAGEAVTPAGASISAPNGGSSASDWS